MLHFRTDSHEHPLLRRQSEDPAGVYQGRIRRSDLPRPAVQFQQQLQRAFPERIREMETFEQFVRVLSGLLTPIIAILAVYIAYQQFQTNNNKYILDRFDRRIVVYKAIEDFLLSIFREAKVDLGELAKFWKAKSDAEFLFGADVREYLNTLNNHAAQLRRWNEEYKDYSQDKPEGYDHDKVVRNQSEHLDWLVSQIEPLKQVFRKYLDISN